MLLSLHIVPPPSVNYPKGLPTSRVKGTSRYGYGNDESSNKNHPEFPTLYFEGERRPLGVTFGGVGNGDDVRIGAHGCVRLTRRKKSVLRKFGDGKEKKVKGKGVDDCNRMLGRWNDWLDWDKDPDLEVVPHWTFVIGG
jgi:hypothetical protein